MKTNEKCKVPYGTEDPVYGGIITNVLELSDGTFFYVNNGAWTGFVDSDESGNKVVYAGVEKVYPITGFINKIVFSKDSEYPLSIDIIDTSKIKRIKEN